MKLFLLVALASAGCSLVSDFDSLAFDELGALDARAELDVGHELDAGELVALDATAELDAGELVALDATAELDAGRELDAGLCLGVRCENEHGSTRCAMFQCQPICSAGWGNCDNRRENGCESRLTEAGVCW